MPGEIREQLLKQAVEDCCFRWRACVSAAACLSRRPKRCSSAPTWPPPEAHARNKVWRGPETSARWRWPQACTAARSGASVTPSQDARCSGLRQPRNW